MNSMLYQLEVRGVAGAAVSEQTNVAVERGCMMNTGPEFQMTRVPNAGDRNAELKGKPAMPIAGMSNVSVTRPLTDQ